MGNLANSTELSDLRMTSGDGPRALMRFIRIPLLALAISIPLGFVGIWLDTHSTHRVVAVWPEHWPSGDYRECLMVKFPEQKLLQLDCDIPLETHRLISETPASRMLTQDVRFDGDNYGQQVYWTCQNKNGELTCKN